MQQLLQAGDRVRITAGSFAERDAIFTAMEGEQRMVLLLSRQQRISVPLASIKKLD